MDERALRFSSRVVTTSTATMESVMIRAIPRLLLHDVFIFLESISLICYPPDPQPLVGWEAKMLGSWDAAICY